MNHDYDEPLPPGEGEPERMGWLDTLPFFGSLLAAALLVFSLQSCGAA